jgi:hypothetical protein
VGSHPDEADFFQIASSHTMALKSTQPLTEMSIRNIKKKTWGGGEGHPVRRADNLAAKC